MKDFRRLFLKGLAALMPTVVTIAVLVWAFNWINDRVASPITSMIISLLPDPSEVNLWGRRPDIAPADALHYGTPIDRLDPETGNRYTIEYLTIYHQACNSTDEGLQTAARRRRADALWHIFFRKYKLSVIGFLIAVAAVYGIGFLLSGLIGRTSGRLIEAGILRVPLIRSIYPNIKQVTDFLFGDRQIDFKGVVAVEYPRTGIWSLGLITGVGMDSIQARADDDLVTIFIPSSPTPVTGYTITVPRSETIELALSIDEALRFTISGGVIKPPQEGGRPEMGMGDASNDSNRLEARREGDSDGGPPTRGLEG